MTKGVISTKIRNINILIFILAFSIMAVVMMIAFSNIIRDIASDYAGRYAGSSANALSSHIADQAALLSIAAHSDAVIDWLHDEDDDDKKAIAFEELSAIIGELYSNNLYIGVKESLNEYSVEEFFASGSISSFDVLDRHDPSDAWFFECVESEHDYLISVGIDLVLDRKRVWLNTKIIHEGSILGVLCTGLEFSHVAGEIFSQIDNNDMRGFIVDESGTVHMDSTLLRDADFLHYAYLAHIGTEISDSVLLETLSAITCSEGGYFDHTSEPLTLRIQSEPYGYATIAPIIETNWSVLVLYDPSSSLNMSLFFPVFSIMLMLLVAFAIATNALSYRLIFKPLELLIRSLPRLKENKEEAIFGLDRNDEFGNLANTIQELFTKANHDPLTGIYNRRFMENNLKHFMEFLSRANGFMGLLMIDIDFFKFYNDTYGHDQGDVCLKAVAGAIEGSIPRTNDFVARYGGEEFVAVLPHTDEAGARIIAAKIIDNITKLSIPHGKNTASPYVSVSVGVTSGRVSYSQSWEEYVKRADEALYMSKQNGRNQYTYLELDDKK